MHCTAKANIDGVEGGEGEALHCYPANCNHWGYIYKLRSWNTVECFQHCYNLCGYVCFCVCVSVCVCLCVCVYANVYATSCLQILLS